MAPGPVRYQAVWSTPVGRLEVREPERGEIALRAGELAADYNEPHNRQMMAHSATLSAPEVESLYGELLASGGRPFFLYLDQRFMGDADFRHVQAHRAEFAIMVGSRAAQGRGLGTRFAAMLHGLAFQLLGFSRVYVTIIPRNVASRKLFARLGYLHDASPQAASYAEADDDICMSVTQAQFERACAELGFELPEIVVHTLG